MNLEQLAFYFQDHWYYVTLFFGVLILLGSIFNWNWLYDPVGKPNSQRYGRGSRRVIFFLLGTVLIIVSIWNMTLL